MEYTARLSYLHLHSVERRRLNVGFILTFTIMFGLVDVCMSDYFQLMSADGDRAVTRGNPFKLSVNYCHTNERKMFFKERVVKVWNGLLPSIVNFSSLTSFRISLNKISFWVYTKY